MSRFFVPIIAFLPSTVLYGVESHAHIQYSWAGKIVPSGVDDPWAIGILGKPFSLSAMAAEGAVDILDDSVQFSAYSLTSVQLLIDGQEVPYVGNGAIDFTDNSAGMFDLVRIDGDFQSLGSSLGIGSIVTLNPTTFSFTQPIEKLPYFPSTVNLDHAASGGKYTFVVEAGTDVTVIPEPKGILLCSIGILLLAKRRNRR